MKRYVLFLLLLTLLFSACAVPFTLLRPAGDDEAPAETAAPTLTEEIKQITATPVVAEPAPAVTQEPQPQAIPVTGASPEANAPEASKMEAVVNVDGLNLRLGPGLNHRILGVLSKGQVVRLEGRSQANDWLVVRLADGREGWAFAVYLDTQADVAALPLMEAYGGPLAAQPAAEENNAPVTMPRNYRLDMAIAGGRAQVSLANFPGEREIVLRLGVRGEGPAMSVASGRTDASGALTLSFDMPAYWPDGSRITQNELRLTAAVTGTDLERGANIVYYAAE